jgi:hypothetical protein
MILLTSLIEMKQSDAIVRKIMQFIPRETLNNLLIECFRGHLMLYDYRYSTEAFKHGEVRPDKHEFDGDREADLWYETIIETGFMCYFMLWEYLEVEGFTDQQHRWYDEAIQLRMSTLYKTDGFFPRFIGFMGLVCRYIWGLFTCCFRACRKRQVEERMYHPDHAQNDNITFKKAFKFYTQHSASIEIMRDDRLEKIRFILPAYYTNLNDDVKDDFEDEVDRTSVKTKLNMLQTKSKFLIRIAKYDKKLNEFVDRWPLLELVSRYD